MAHVQKAESVVFYSWIENRPSNLAIAVEGGGMKTKEPLKEIRFTKGRFQTSDPSATALLRKLIADGDNITEDFEMFLSKTTTPEEQKDRIAQQNKELLAENERLKKALAS